MRSTYHTKEEGGYNVTYRTGITAATPTHTHTHTTDG